MFPGSTQTVRIREPYLYVPRLHSNSTNKGALSVRRLLAVCMSLPQQMPHSLWVGGEQIWTWLYIDLAWVVNRSAWAQDY